MPKQARKSRKPKPVSKSSAEAMPTAAAGPDRPQFGSLRLRQSLPAVLAFLVGMLIVWAFLVPADATSVFMGEALPQNLFWLLVGVLAATSAALNGGLVIPRWRILGPLVLLFLLVLSTYQAGEACSPRRAWFGFWQVCSLAVAYYATSYLSAHGNATRTALALLVLAGLLAASVHGIYQVSVEFPEARARYLADPDGEIAQIPGLYAPKGSPQRMRFEDRLLQSREPYANYALANSLGAVLSACLLLLVGMVLHRTGLGGRIWPQTQVDSPATSSQSHEHEREASSANSVALSLIPLGVCVGLVFSTWFLSSSRVAYLAVLVGIGLMLVLPFVSRLLGGQKSKVPFGAFAGGFSGLGLIVAFGVWWIGRSDRLVLAEAGKSLGYRLEYWRATWQMVMEHPWLGVGFGNFQAHYPVYKLAQASEEIADPHNWLLDWAASYGLLATLLIVCWLLGVFWRGFKGIHSGDRLSSTLDSDGTVARFLMFGGVLGGLGCASLLVLLKGLDPWVLAITWGPAAVLLILVYSSVQQLVSRRFVFLSAWVAIGLCLLITGSWQAAGIAIPLFILMVLSGGGVSVETSYWSNRELVSVTDVGKAVGVPLLAVAGLVVFVFQSWMPVTQAWAYQQSAAFADSYVEQEQLAKSARDTDTLDADLQGGVAQLAVTKALQSDRGLFTRRATEAVAELEAWLALEKTSFAAWRDAGNQAFSLLNRAVRDGVDTSNYAESAERYYAMAVQQYPTSAELRVQWAAILALQGRQDQSESEIQMALKLSEESPHEDKRLGRHRTQGDGDQLIWFPIVPPGRTDLGDSCPVPNMVYAEPLIEWIRSQSGDQGSNPSIEQP